MPELFSALLAVDFLPHGFCMRWQNDLLGLHVLSDAGIAVAYACIPVLLAIFFWRRRDIQFNWIVLLFASFILACGLTHVLEIVTLWRPIYWFAGLVKGLTAIVSLATAAALVRLMPKLLQIPSPQRLSEAVRALEQEVRVRERMEQELAARVEQELKRAASERDQGEERLRATFDNAAIGLAHVSPEGRFVRVNRHLCEMLGYSAAELLQKSFGEITHPKDLEEDWALANQLLAGEIGIYSLEKRYFTKSGETIWINLTVSLVRRSDGQPDYFISAIENITKRRLTEQKLRQREQQLAMVFDEGSIGDWTWDIASDQVKAHSSVWKMYGAPGAVESMPASWVTRRQHPDDATAIETASREALAGRKPLDLEFRVVMPDGGVRWLACRGTVERNGAGEPVQMHGLNLDITSRKNAEAAMARSERQFRQLIDVIPQIVWFTAPSGAAEFFNERWYGYTGQDAQSSLDWGWVSVIHPDDVPKAQKLWRRSVATGEPYEIEYRLRAGDGSYRWFLGRGLPLREESGEIARWFGSCTDIDGMKQAEAQTRFFNQQLEVRVIARTSELQTANEKLTQTQARLQSVLDSATQVAIISVDERGVIQLFNTGAEHMLRTPAKEVMGQQTLERFERLEERQERARQISEWVGRDVSAADVYLASSLPMEAHTRETVFLRPDGSLVYVSVASAPLLDRRGARSGTLVIATNITKRKELELQLTSQTRRAEAANRAKSEFLATMSHEIRTPMNAILGMADLLWETELDPVQQEYVERFRRAGSNLLTLINDILDLSKIEAGRFELERIEFGLEEIFERTVELMRPRATARELVLDVRLLPEVPTRLTGDPARLQQVLMNLVGNAIKFTERGEISLSVQPHPSKTPGHLLFQVRDTGIGIPLEKLESIFEDFTQADNTITRRFGGTGLGLGIARRLVRRFGGDLTVQSVVGQGTTFSFDAAFGVAAQPPASQRAAAQNLAGKRVLIVDNNETNRLIFTEMCSSWGMLPSQVESAGAVGRALLEGRESQKAFSLIILDRLMPVMDGFGLVEVIRQIDRGVAIILTTSDDRSGDATRAQALGLSYARKPVRRADLLRLIASVLPDAPDASTLGGAPSRPPTVLEAAQTEGPIRVLVAEDSEDNRFLLSSYLRDGRYEVTMVENGEEALERFRAERFDLVLLDVQMPVMDGLTASAAIRAYESVQGSARTPMLALTANALREDFERSATAGCDGHLAKPISKAALLGALSRYVKRPRVPPAPASNGTQEPRPETNVDRLIRIPPGLEAAARRYIRTRLEEVRKLQALLNASDFEGVRVLAHNMKGAGQSFGFPPLTTLGAEMEVAAQRSDMAQLNRQLDRVNEYVNYAASMVLGDGG